VVRREERHLNRTRSYPLAEDCQGKLVGSNAINQSEAPTAKSPIDRLLAHARELHGSDVLGNDFPMVEIEFA
jgi:hypothetical protein